MFLRARRVKELIRGLSEAADDARSKTTLAPRRRGKANVEVDSDLL